MSLLVSVAIALLVTERGALRRASSSSRAHGIGDTRLEFDEFELVAGSLPLELAPDVVVLVADSAGGELVFEALVVITVNGDGAEIGMVVVAVGGGGGGGGGGTILPGII